MICVSSVSVYPYSVTLKVGNWYYGAYAEVCPTYASCKSVRWYSNNTNVATVNAATGYIYARGAGTARIYAQATDGSGKSDYLNVYVTSNSVKVSSVELNRSVLYLEKNETYTLSATVCPNTATNKSLNWSSSNGNVAAVSGGRITAKANGYTSIRATAADGSGKQGYCTVTVTAPVKVTSVTVCPETKTMNVGETAYLDVTVCPTNAANKRVTWCSSNENVACVDYYTGQIYANAVGTAVVTAATVDGGLQACCKIEVSLTDKQLSEQIMFCFSLLTEYSSYAYISPMQYAVLKNLNSEEAAMAEQTELLQSIQLVNYILLENKLVANSPTASTTIAKHILSGEKYDIFEQAEITQDIRNHSDTFDAVWRERNKQSWLELAQLLLVAGTMIPYIQIPSSLILLGQGVVGKDLTGRQLYWWERALDIISGVLATIEGIGFLASAIKNANNVKVLDKLDDVARIAGDHAASEFAYALRTGGISNRVLNGSLDAALINKAKGFRGSFVDELVEYGDVAVAEVNISGLKTDWFAHSRIDFVSDIQPAGAVSNISLKPNNPVFTATEIGGFMRDVDTEYKILNDIANSLGNNTSAVGTIKLLTERPPCDSCANVIMQFTNKYKNIVIEVVDNGHQLLIP